MATASTEDAPVADITAKNNENVTIGVCVYVYVCVYECVRVRVRACVGV